MNHKPTHPSISQESLPVAILGKPGSYHHQAAQQVFGLQAQCDFFANIELVAANVANGSHRGVIAIHNTEVGNLENHCLLLDTYSDQLKIIKHLNLSIQHRLVTAKPTNLKEIKVILSHPAALRQCHEWLNRHPWIKTQTWADTASAVESVCQTNDPTKAAIGSAYAAQLYGGHCYPKLLINTPNSTVFAVVVPHTSREEKGASRLATYRSQIDAIDQSIVSLLAKRIAIVKKIGLLKKSSGKAVYDPQREKTVLEQLVHVGTPQGIPKQLILNLYQQIFRFSREMQKQEEAT
ncbi:chorismate mutase [Candidatus Woesebacteria bacterium]|nr:chorismate mutase [Candidatus Woesebacteria bacterium]